MLLGRFVLHERLNRLQWTAVGDRGRRHFGAGGGRARPAVDQPRLCVSFALYGLLRKIVTADAVTGLAIETGDPVPAGHRLARLAALARQPVMGDSA